MVGIKESNRVYLNPLKPLKELREIGFYTFDVETKDGLKGILLFCWSLAYRTKARQYKTLNGKESIRALFKQKLEKWKDKNHYKTIFVHNLSFDIRFIIDYCIKHEMVYKPIISGSNFIACMLDEMLIQFIDSFQFLRTSQEKAEKEWDIDHNVMKIHTIPVMRELFNNWKYKEKLKPFELWTEEEKTSLIEHCKNDTIALHKIMIKYRQIIYEIAQVDMLSVISLGSLAMKCLRITLSKPICNPFLYFAKSENGRPKYEIDHEKEEFVRKSYFGGRNEVYDLKRLKDVLYIDVVSMYVAMMKFKEYPVGYPQWFGNTVKELEYLNEIIDGKRKELGFIDVWVEKGQTQTNYPVLPIRLNNHVMFTNCSFFGCYTTVELQYARKLGYKIVPIRGLIFPESEKIFENFVDKLYPIKQKNKGGRREGAKRLLLSGYGKFGQKFELPMLDLIYFTEQEQLDEYYLNEPEEKYDIHYNEDSRIYMGLRTEMIEITQTFMIVSIASFITSYARLHLLEAIHELEQTSKNRLIVKYADTDSINIQKKHQKYYKNLMGKELGKWDIEQKFDEVQYFAPKAYISMQTFMKELDVLNISIPKHISPKRQYKLYDSHPKIKLKGVNSMKLREIENCKEVCYAKNKLDKIEELIKQPIQMAEIYMKFKEAHRYGLVLATKEPVKAYSFENLKRNFHEKKGNSRAWDNETLPETYKNELIEHNNEYLNNMNKNIKVG